MMKCFYLASASLDSRLMWEACLGGRGIQASSFWVTFQRLER